MACVGGSVGADAAWAADLTLGGGVVASAGEGSGAAGVGGFVQHRLTEILSVRPSLSFVLG